MKRTDLERIICALEQAHENTQATTNKPADTVNAFVSAVGLDAAAYCIAAMVRRVRFDGRISRYAKAWADGQDGLDMPEDWMQAVPECYSSAIHPAHLSQLAEAMEKRLAQPDPEESQEEPQEESESDTIRDLYAIAVAVLPTGDIDHHETDLYIRKSPLTDALVDLYQYRRNVTTFRAADGSGLWYDVPFAYAPAWRARLGQLNPLCLGCSQAGATCAGTTETTWSDCIYRNTDTPPVSGTHRRPPEAAKAIADATAAATLNADLRGAWSNLRFEHHDAAGWWYSYDLRGQGRQVLRVRVPADCAAERGDR